MLRIPPSKNRYIYIPFFTFFTDFKIISHYKWFLDIAKVQYLDEGKLLKQWANYSNFTANGAISLSNKINSVIMKSYVFL